MLGYFNIDKAAICVKTIVDNSRCIFCDEIRGSRLRYPCGHTVCGECVEASDECLTCFNLSQSSKPLIDSVHTQHVQNVYNLLTAFQESFDVDVYKRYRLSEKLKEEKRLFPDHIQASVTYHNKRKLSLNASKENKENLSPIVLAGELLSLQRKTMNTRCNLVQKWLETNEKVQSPVRKPFTDINVNTTFVPSKENTPLINRRHLYNQETRKKNADKSLKLKENSISRKQNKSTKIGKVIGKNKKEKEPVSEIISEKILHEKEYHQHENYRTIGNIDTVVIEDSPTQDFDKDKKAWLAVLEYEKNISNDKKQINSIDNTIDYITKIKTHAVPDLSSVQKKVCFYKKGLLYKSCLMCLNSYKNDFSGYHKLNSKDMCILVSTSTLLTSIKVTDIGHEINIKKSISTQTDDSNKDMHTAIIPNDNEQVDITSQDLFVNDTYLYEEIEKNTKNIEKEELKNISNIRGSDLPPLIINDSDSDVDIECSGSFEVVADVHTPSMTDYGVLSTVDNNQQRVRYSGRRRTIDSNNSSEKENLEPNRLKKPRLGKKHEMKKKL